MNAFTRVTESPESLNTMPVKDELGIYHVEAPDLPDDVVFPDEVNRYLRDRIKVSIQSFFLKKKPSIFTNAYSI